VGLYTYLQRLFYARGDFRTPLVTAVFVTAVDIALSLWLKETFLRVRGLAYANSIAFTLGTVVLLVRANALLEGIPIKELGRSSLKVILAVIPLYGVTAAFTSLTEGRWEDGSSWAGLALLAIVGVVSAAVLIGLYYLLRVELVTSFLKERLRRNQ
jgi:putative peptidoglycan lipid II flippase